MHPRSTTSATITIRLACSSANVTRAHRRLQRALNLAPHHAVALRPRCPFSSPATIDSERCRYLTVSALPDIAVFSITDWKVKEACLPRSAAFSQPNPFTCKQQLVPAMLLKRSCRAAQNACQPAASLVSPAAALLQEIVPASFPASSPPFLASLSPCHPVCSGR